VVRILAFYRAASPHGRKLWTFAEVAAGLKILTRGAVGKYIEFISSSGYDYPIELLKEAGVNMTGAEPFNKTMAAMNRTMDEIEAILDKKGG
jgi:oligoendopeptidase F